MKVSVGLSEPRDTCLTQVRLLNVPKLPVNCLQELGEIRFGGRFVKFFIACGVGGGVPSRVKLRVELLHVLLCPFQAVSRQAA